MGPRQGRSNATPAPVVSAEDASMDEVIDLLREKRSTARVEALSKIVTELSRNSELEFLSEYAVSLGDVLSSAFKRAASEERCEILSLISKLILLDSDGSVVLDVLGQFPKGFLRDTLSEYAGTPQNPTLGYAVVAIALYVMFLSGENAVEADAQVYNNVSDVLLGALRSCAGEDVEHAERAERVERADDAADSMEDEDSEGAVTNGTVSTTATATAPKAQLEHIQAVLPTIEMCATSLCLLSRVQASLALSTWIEDDDNRTILEECLKTADPVLTEVIGTFAATLVYLERSTSEEHSEGIGATQFTAALESVSGVFGRGISRKSKKTLRETASSLLSEVSNGNFEEQTIGLPTRENLRLHDRDACNRYAFCAAVLGAAMQTAVCGNAGVRDFLGLPPPSAKFIIADGCALEEGNRRAEHRERAAARAEKEIKRRTRTDNAHAN